MINYYGVSFLPYHRLRIAAVTDHIAERTSGLLGRRSPFRQVLRVDSNDRVWREAHYYENVNDANGQQSRSTSFWTNTISSTG
jgi:hypothetical protein